MNHDRLRQIEKNLSLLREQLAGKEEALITAPASDKVRIKQEIRLQLLPEIQEYEQERWQILASHSAELAITEPEAEVFVAEIVESVGKLERQTPDQVSQQMLQLLQEIRDQLQQPGNPAAAKLKAAISALPPFINISYEAELDTEAFLRKYFPTFTDWIKGAAKK
jgi:DNA repair exonuclease SbcCD ATPase subunit